MIENNTEAERMIMSEAHLKLVNRIAAKINSSYNFIHDHKDLVQWGSIGLLEAYRNFKADMGASFTTFAGRRISGAIVDGIRSTSVLSRYTHEMAKRIQTLREEYRGEREATVIQKISEDMALPEKAIREIESIKLSSETISYSSMEADDSIMPSKCPGPEELFFISQDVYDIINHPVLNEKESRVLQMFFLKDLSLSEISDFLSISERRVSQIKLSAIQKIKEVYEKQS